MYLGDYIVIKDQIGEFTFSCESVSTGTLFSASVDQDKRAIYANRTLQDMHPSACPFLRPDGHLIRCTIHRDSPVQCKAYRCTAIRIIGEGGRLIGRVTGTLALHSDDPRLREIWNEIEKGRPVSDCDAEEWIASFLKMRGYRIE